MQSAVPLGARSSAAKVFRVSAPRPTPATRRRNSSAEIRGRSREAHAQPFLTRPSSTSRPRWRATCWGPPAPPAYDNREFYSPYLQAPSWARPRARRKASTGSSVRSRSGFARRPYCALGARLIFEGNKLFVAANRAFGELVARLTKTARAARHYVQPSTDIPSPRAGRIARGCTRTPRTGDAVGSSDGCVRADRAGGGRSRVSTSIGARRCAERVGRRRSNCWRTVSPLASGGLLRGGVRWRTVLGESDVLAALPIDLALGAGRC